MPRLWTNAELQLLKDLYPDTEVEKMELIIGRTKSAIYGKANDLGLKRSAEFEQKMKAFTNKNLIEGGVKTRFLKGSVPANKGQKMSAETYKRCAKTMFKKGQIPHNHKPIGHERITKDGYTEVKVRDGNEKNKNFELKHRLIWEQNNGPIPEGMNVEFLDGNRENFAIENLVLRTKKENLLKNSFSDSSICKRMLGVKDEKEIEIIKEKAPELINMKRNQLKLNKQIQESCK